MNTLIPKCLTISTAIIVLGACTSLPEVTIPYYLPMTEVPVRISRVVACSKTAPLKLHQAIAIDDIKPIYLADTARTYYFSTERQDHRLSDATINFSFHPDGRLKGVNGSSTGKGAETIKAVAGLLTTTRVGAQARKAPSQPTVDKACTYISNTSPNSSKSTDSAKPTSLTLVYEATVRLHRDGQIDIVSPLVDKGDPSSCEAQVRSGRTNIKPVLASLADHCALRGVIDDFHLLIDPAISLDNSWKYGKTPKCRANRIQDCENQVLWVARPARRGIRILQCPASSLTAQQTEEREAQEEHDRLETALKIDQPSRRHDIDEQLKKAAERLADAKHNRTIDNHCKHEGATIAHFEALDSANGSPMEVRLPEPKAFGGNKFTLMLSDSGAIEDIEYSKTASGDAVPNAIGSLAEAIRGPSFAETTQSIKDEADRIAALQRLARCKADPTTCQ